jgi:hypothetical protein
MLALSTYLVWGTPLWQDLFFRLDAFLADWQSVAGTVLTAEPSSASWGLLDHWRYSHTFHLHDGAVIRGDSYGPGGRFDVGDTVFIQYDPGHPESNHIIGLHRGPPMAWFHLSLAVPLVALLFLGLGVTRQWVELRLLERGMLIWANVDRYQAGSGKCPFVPAALRYRTCHLSYAIGRKVFHTTWRLPTWRSGRPAEGESVLVVVDAESPGLHRIYDTVSGAPPRNATGEPLQMPPAGALLLFLPAFLGWVNLLFLMLTI